MKRYYQLFVFIFTLIIFLPSLTQAQVSINQNNSAPDASAMLDIQSTDKGLLIPRMNGIDRDAIPNPVPGLMIFNVDDSCFNYFTGKNWIKDCGRDPGFLPRPVSASDGGNGKEIGNGISNDAAGNSYVIGFFDGSSNFGETTITSSGHRDILIAKYDPSGRIQWVQQAGGINEDRGMDISTDAAGNSYITGDFKGSATFGDTTLTSSGNRDVFVAKIDPNGKVIWAQQAGGSDEDQGWAISTDPAGNSYITGDFKGSATFGDTTLTSSGYRDIFVAKIDPSGQLIWAQKAGGSGYESAYGIYSDASGNCYITGFLGGGSPTFGDTTLTSLFGTDIFAAKFDPSGQVIWVRHGGGGGGGENNGWGISSDAAGNCYFTGFFELSFTFGDTTLTNNGDQDILIAKIDPLGELLWIQKVGGSVPDIGCAITTDVSGNSYITGVFGGSATFGDTTLTSINGGDIFVAKFDPLGQGVWATHSEGSSDNYGRGISIDAAGNIHVTGEFAGTATFGNQTLSANGDRDLFVWELNGTDGTNTPYELSLSELHDDDTDPVNEIQSLNLLGDTLFLSQGNGVDISGIDTDNQTIDKFSLNGSTLEMSLQDDGQSDQTVDLSSIDTDNQTIDKLALNGSTLEVSLQDDGQSDQTVDLSSIDTDNQTIDKLALNGSTLEMSLQDDGQSDQTVDLSSIDTDNQTIDKLALNGSTLEVSLQDDGQSDQTVDLSSIDTDNQTIDKLALNGSTLEISLQGDGQIDQTVDLFSIDTDNQTIDKLALNGSTLEVSLQDDGQSDQTVDLTGLKDNLGNHTTSQNLQLGSNWLSGDGDNEGLKIDGSGNIGFGVSTPLHQLDLGITLGRKLALYQNTGGSSFYGFGISGGTFELYAAADVSAEPKMVVKGYTGNVGIGMDDPLAKLTVNGSTTLYGDSRKISFKSYQSNGSNTQLSEIRTNMYAPSGIGNPPFVLDASTRYMSFHVANNNGGGMAQVLTLRGDGHVGIGINNPDKKLHVHSDGGNTRFQSKTSGASSFTDWLNHDGSVRGIVGVDGSGYSGNNNQFAISTWTAHPIVFRANQSERMRITSSGNIGIGTNNPTKAKVEISGSQNFDANNIGYLNSGGNTGSYNPPSFPYSLYASNVISGQEFHAHSDKRIKQIEGISDSETDLETLMQIDITDYRLKDSIAKGNRPIKKVIAQQVAEVYPQAVTRNLTEVVPDIYQRAEVQDGWIMLATGLKVGDRVKLITEASSEIYEVIEAEATRFKVFSLSDFNSDLFVYGREVNDFHTVDYEAISMLNVSATQEQQARIEELETIIIQLRNDNTHLKKENTSFESRLQALEALLIEKSDSIKK